MTGKSQEEVRSLKPNRYIIIDDEPCKILSITTSKPGKHGEAKAKIDAVGLFDGAKRTVVHPVKHKAGAPEIDKRKAQVVSIQGNEVQLMDMDTYETFELTIEEDVKGQMVPGKEIQYFEALGRKKISKVD